MPRYKSTKITYPEPKTMYLVSESLSTTKSIVETIKVQAESDKSYWILVQPGYSRFETLKIVQKRPDFILHETWEQARQHLISLFRNRVELMQRRITSIERQIESIQTHSIPEAEALADPTLLINTLS